MNKLILFNEIEVFLIGKHYLWPERVLDNSLKITYVYE